MYSLCITSSTLERSVRTTTPVNARPSASAGSVSVRSSPLIPPLYPATGNHPSSSPKISANISPSQNPGIANVSVVPTRIDLSVQRFGRSAAAIASGTPTSSEISML